MTLGKPSIRGIRKLPKCGTYDGTQGLSCKKKTCDIVLKGADKNKKWSCDVVRLFMVIMVAFLVSAMMLL